MTLYIAILAISLLNGLMLPIKQEKPLESQFGVNLIVTRPQSEVTPLTEKEEILYYIDFYASEYKIDENLLSNIIRCESRFDPNAKNKSSSAEGLAQWVSMSWVSARTQMKESTDLRLRTNIQEAVKTTAFYISRNSTTAWNSSKSCWLDKTK